MIVVVDGTGADSDVQYAKDMEGSFCNQIADTLGGTYFRGPSLTGIEVSSIADKAVTAANQLAALGRPIYLAGYSRGGCTVIIAAKRLQQAGKAVKGMFLFDAVDMQSSELGLSQVITSNVGYVAHIRSARNLKFWAKNPNRSRWYFLNTGRWLAGNGTMDEHSVVATHGAIGGTPWNDIGGDRAAALGVAAWMTPKLQSQGLNVTLKLINKGSTP